MADADSEMQTSPDRATMPEAMDTTLNSSTLNDSTTTSILSHHYLDALPYLDTEYTRDPELQSEVKQLLDEEMSTLTRTPEDYLRDFLQQRQHQEQYQQYETPLLTAAFESLANSTPQPSGLDLSRYKLEPPASTSPDAWRAAIANASAQLEHQTNRAVNLELLKKFGPTNWKLHNEQLTQLKQELSSSLEHVKADVELLNRKRKSEQLSAGSELQLLENGYYNLIWKNHEIEYACYKLERELEAKNGGTTPNTEKQKTKMQKI